MRLISPERGARVRTDVRVRRRAAGGDHRRSSTTAGCATRWPADRAERRARCGSARRSSAIDRTFDGRDGHDPGRRRSPPTSSSTAPGCTRDRLARLAGLEPAVRIIPFRGEYFELAPAAGTPGQGADLPGARPDAAVPRRAPDPDDRRRRARRAERRAGAGPGGLHLGRRATAATSRTACAGPGCGGWARSTGAPASARCAVAVAQRFLASLRELVPGLPDGCLGPTRCRGAGPSGAPGRLLVDDFYYERGIRAGARAQRALPGGDGALEIGKPSRWATHDLAVGAVLSHPELIGSRSHTKTIPPSIPS